MARTLADMVLSATTGADIVEALTHYLWTKEHPGTACPPDRVPTEQGLCELDWDARDILDANDDAGAALGDLFDGMTGLHWRPVTMQGPDGPGPSHLFVARVHHGALALENLADVHRAWCDLPAPRPPHPLAALVTAWQRRPAHADRNARPDRPLPARLGMVQGGDSRAGRLFTPALHTTRGGQLILPGFGADVSMPTPALPLHLYDLGIGDAVEQRGRGAPLALRLWVESVLSVSVDARTGDRPVVLEVTLRELLAAIYPNGAPSPARYWPRLLAAVEALDSTAARIPWEDPETGKRGLRRVVSVSDLPPYPRRGHREDLDNTLRLIVDLPPGAANGPIITPTLPLWGVKSAAAYRALIGLHFRWWEPGKTRRPVGRGARRVWYQSDNPRDYGPPLTDAEAVALCFPTSTRKQRRNLTPLSWQVLTTLTDAGELRNIRGVLLPPKTPGNGGEK